LSRLAVELNLRKKITNMFDGEKINSTEKRKVWHMMLRHADAGLNDATKDVH